MCMFDIWYMKNCGKSYKESETEVHSPVCSSDTIAFYCHSKSFWNKIWWANFVHFVYKKADNIQAFSVTFCCVPTELQPYTCISYISVL